MTDLHIVEHHNQRLLTTAQLAAAYGTVEKYIRKNFENNKDHYVAGKHYFFLEGEELKKLLSLHASFLRLQNVSKIRSLYLWTEKGALMHAKSLNTDKAWQAYELLVDGYYRLIEQLEETHKQRSPVVNALWEQRLRLFSRKNTFPPGYWTLFGEVGAYCFLEEFRGSRLSEPSTPDISIGRFFCQHLRTIGYDMSRIKKYPHHYPDQRGVQWANLYPDDCLLEFRRWFPTYLHEHWPEYLQTHQLLSPPEQKQLPTGWLGLSHETGKEDRWANL